MGAASKPAFVNTAQSPEISTPCKTGIGGLQDAVINGLCVTALTRATLLPGMRTLREDEGFPRLDPLRIGLFYKHPRLSPAGLELVRVLVADLEAMAPAMGTGSA